MKIVPPVALALSTLLLSVGAARAQTPTASPAARPPAPSPAASPQPTTPAPTPGITPVPSGVTTTAEPEGMSPEEVEELVRQSVRENIETSDAIEERVEAAVDREVDGTLETISTLLDTLRWGLGVVLVTGAVALWFARRNAIARIQAVEKETDTLKGEIERSMASSLAPSTEIDPQAQIDRDPAQVQEVVSMALSVQNIMASARGALEEAVQTQERFGEQLQELARYQLKEARDLMEAREYDRAIELYDKAIQLNADDPSLLCDRGAALIQLDRYEEASEAYGRATELSPDNAQIWYDLARARALQGSVAQAVAHLKQALQLNPQMGERAKSDADFAIVRENEWFQTTVGTQRS
ncbi:MAG: tetratricopeptide repeat protein [Cyanobacteriota bacterium]|nr:tetratricopeptide repeat protein [Cyanobacteriota bacterium]